MIAIFKRVIVKENNIKKQRDRNVLKRSLCLLLGNERIRQRDRERKRGREKERKKKREKERERKKERERERERQRDRRSGERDKRVK